MAKLGLRRHRGYKIFIYFKPPPKPPEAKGETKKEESPTSGMTETQKKIFYPGPDMPTPESEPE